MPSSRPPYPEEFRREAVTLVRSARAQSDAEAQALRAEVDQIAAAGPIRALRLRRKLRAATHKRAA